MFTTFAERSTNLRSSNTKLTLHGHLELDGHQTANFQHARAFAFLVQRNRRNKDHNSRSTYLMLVKVFEQQCDVVDDKVVIRKKTGGDIVCNPSDPDATFDGHKGSGYQVQLSETCGPDNDVQLIVSAIPETAVNSDAAALEIVIDDLKERGLLPDQMLADTAYGSDDNDLLCRIEEISLVTDFECGVVRRCFPASC